MEPDQIDVFAFAVLRDFEEVENAEEARLSRQLRSDVQETDRRDRIHFDFPFFHSIPGTDCDAWTRPDANAAGDLPATNSFAKTLGEQHAGSL